MAKWRKRTPSRATDEIRWSHVTTRKPTTHVVPARQTPPADRSRSKPGPTRQLSPEEQANLVDDMRRDPSVPDDDHDGDVEIEVVPGDETTDDVPRD